MADERNLRFRQRECKTNYIKLSCRDANERAVVIIELKDLSG